MTYVKIIMALLQIVEAVLDWSREQRFRQEGADEEIAKASIRILQRTEYANRSLGDFTGKSESDVLSFLRSLEPKV
jgi:hypothetical protein